MRDQKRKSARFLRVLINSLLTVSMCACLRGSAGGSNSSDNETTLSVTSHPIQTKLSRVQLVHAVELGRKSLFDDPAIETGFGLVVSVVPQNKAPGLFSLADPKLDDLKFNGVGYGQLSKLPRNKKYNPGCTVYDAPKVFADAPELRSLTSADAYSSGAKVLMYAFRGAKPPQGAGTLHVEVGWDKTAENFDLNFRY